MPTKPHNLSTTHTTIFVSITLDVIIDMRQVVTPLIMGPSAKMNCIE